MGIANDHYNVKFVSCYSFYKISKPNLYNIIIWIERLRYSNFKMITLRIVKCYFSFMCFMCFVIVNFSHFISLKVILSHLDMFNVQLSSMFNTKKFNNFFLFQLFMSSVFFLLFSSSSSSSSSALFSVSIVVLPNHAKTLIVIRSVSREQQLQFNVSLSRTVTKWMMKNNRKNRIKRIEIIQGMGMAQRSHFDTLTYSLK